MIGFISEKLLIPILDFFYGLVPSYGLAIVALTVVIRIALFPLSAGSIRSARRMKIAQPVMQKRQAEIKSKFSGDPKKQQEELGKLMNEFGSPLAGCLPLIVQMPVLFALFATLRGSPFADVPYNINLKVVPQDQIATIDPKPYKSPRHSIFITEKSHFPVVATIPNGTKLGTEESIKINLQTTNGNSYSEVLSNYNDGSKFLPTWKVSKGSENLKVQLDSTTIDSLLQFVGIEKVSITEEGKLVKMNPGVYLEFNAIGKGYAVDRIAKYLELHGAKNYLVEVGGELSAKGVNLDKNKPWRVGIDDPNQTEAQRTITSVLTLNDRAMATSGNYRKFRVDSVTGKKYVHTINPNTGLASKSNLLSASVLAENCALADGYATAFMAMGLEKSKETLEQLPSVDAFLIYDENGEVKTYATKGFQKVLQN